MKINIMHTKYADIWIVEVTIWDARMNKKPANLHLFEFFLVCFFHLKDDIFNGSIVK